MKKAYSFFTQQRPMFFLFLFIVVSTGCKSRPEVQIPVPAPPKVVLAPGDQIEIKFAYAEQFNEQQTIRPDGKIELQFVGEVAAAGKTPTELREELKQLFTPHLKYPQLAVMVRTFVDNRVYVGGEVKTPGIIEMPGRLTVLEAIMQAGGFNMVTAKTKNVMVLRQKDGKMQGYPVDLQKTLAGNSADVFSLEPRDIIFVPQSTIVRVDQWVDQFINKSIPNMGFTINRTSPSGRTSWGYDTGD